MGTRSLTWKMVCFAMPGELASRAPLPPTPLSGPAHFCAPLMSAAVARLTRVLLGRRATAAREESVPCQAAAAVAAEDRDPDIAPALELGDGRTRTGAQGVAEKKAATHLAIDR